MKTIDINNIVTRIGFLGPHGTFSEEAAREIWKQISFFKNERCELVPCANPHILKMALIDQRIDWAVIPIRNSITGPVNNFLDEFEPLSEFDVTCSFDLSIHHCLFKLPGVKDSDLRFVFSHPQALAQTEKTRQNSHFGKLQERITASTGLAAKMLSEGIIPRESAVICSNSAGIANSLELIKANIEDESGNTTTFLLLGI